MKPTRNRFFCRACGKAKMLFETESRAMNYIKFNRDEVYQAGGHAPVRAYYCNVCMGWHVTSNSNAEHFNGWKSKAESAVDSYIQQQETRQRYIKSKLFNRGQEYYAKGEHKNATDSFLQSFHAQKDKHAGEQTPQCLESLKEAFASACREVSAMLERDYADAADLKRCATLVKSLSKAAVYFQDEFNEQLLLLGEAYGRIQKMTSCIVQEKSSEEKEIEALEKERQKEEKKSKKRKRLVSELPRELSRIHCFIIAGHRLESERLLHVTASRIRELLEYEDTREDALKQIDDILAVKKEFEETFGLN